MDAEWNPHETNTVNVRSEELEDVQVELERGQQRQQRQQQQQQGGSSNDNNDDDDEVVHDQLPNVEEYKANNGGGGTGELDTERRKIGTALAAGFAVCIFFIILGIIIGKTTDDGNNNKNMEGKSGNLYSQKNAFGDDPWGDVNNPAGSGGVNPNNNDVIPPDYPDDQGDLWGDEVWDDISNEVWDDIQNDPFAQDGNDGAINAPDTDDLPERLQRAIDMIEIQGWSKPAAFVNKESPQYKAARWLADTDPAQLTFAEGDLDFLQRYVLATLYFSLGGDQWKYKLNFLSEDQVCVWSQFWKGTNLEDGHETFHQVGVICEVSNTVKRIYLPRNQMIGELPPELALLEHLREINFYKNYISGTIPDEYANMKKLEALVLHDNRIEGSVPAWFPSTPMLTVINLGDNEFSGALPSTINQTTNLTVLNIEGCQLTGDLLPLKGISTLQALHLGHNKLTGQLSNETFDSWPLLEELDLGKNELTGPLPSNLLAQPNLKVIDLHNNAFNGKLEGLLVNVNSQLRVLALHENQLTGMIGQSVYSLTQLQHLDLSNNKFTGDLPTQIGDLVNLKYLFIAYNEELTPGPIPQTISRLVNLVDLSLQRSNRKGTIPFDMGMMTELALLDLSYNYLSGPIPVSFGELTKLRFLLLSTNPELSGAIPDTMSQLVNLDTLLVDSTSLSGGANVVCTDDGGTIGVLRRFEAECNKIQCTTTCCSTCCDALQPGESCDDPTFYIDVDPTQEYRYVRQFYQLNEEDIVYPEVTEPEPDDFPLGEDLMEDLGVLIPEDEQDQDLVDYDEVDESQIVNPTLGAYDPFGMNDATPEEDIRDNAPESTTEAEIQALKAELERLEAQQRGEGP